VGGRPRFPEDAETLLELVESDWDAFAQALANTPEWGLSKCMMALMPEIQARPDLVKLLREALPRLARPVHVETFEQWLPRRIIVPGGRSFAQIAEALAREHDPGFPALDFDSPLAKCDTRARREGSESTKELIQDGRGWRFYCTAYDYGPAEVCFYGEDTATAIHPEWTLTVTRTDEVLGSKKPTTFWSRFQSWEKLPEAEAVILGMAEITDTIGGTVGRGRLVVGTMNPDHGVRLSRDGNVCWQGTFEKLTAKKGEGLPIEQGRDFGVKLEGFSDIQVGDVLECFTRQPDT